MSHQPNVATVSAFIDKHKEVLHECGIKNPAIAFSAKKIPEDPKDFKLVEEWFIYFEKVIANYQDRKKLVPQERWDMYQKMGLGSDITEIRLLRVAKKLLVENWRKRPETLHRKTINVTETTGATNKPTGKPTKAVRAKAKSTN